MNSDSPIFDERPPAPSAGSKNLMWVLFAVLGVVILGGGFLWMVQMAREARTAARMSHSRNNLKQIGLALHNYHDVYNTFPPSAIVDEQGKPRQGWMYSILPFVDQSPLYDRIDANAAWDDRRNATPSHVPLEIYLNPAIPSTMSGDGYPVAHYAGNSHLFHPNGMFRFRDMTDGSRDTLMVGEINDGFPPWARPGNTRDPALGINKGPDTFGSPFEGGANFLMCDGSVHFIVNDIDPQILKALATPNGDESLPPDW